MLTPCIEFTFIATSAETRLKVFSRSANFTDPTVLYIDEMQIVAHERYTADVVSFSDYYPFGMLMPGRNQSSEYRYGFNAQEKDDEVAGSGNSYTAEFWQYDARLGRRWNRDPKPNPAISDYACFAGNPILYSDPLGDTIKVSGGVGFRVRINFQLAALRLLGSKEIRDMVKDINKDEDIVYIDDNAVPGTSPNARISMFAKRKYYRRLLLVRKVESDGKVKFIRMREMPTLANELSHKYDQNVATRPKGDSYFHYKNTIENVPNEEIKSNRIENLVHSRFLSRKREEGTHAGALFSYQGDTRGFLRLVRRRYRDNQINAKRLAKYGAGNYKVRDKTTNLYNKSSTGVKTQYIIWKEAHID